VSLAGSTYWAQQDMVVGGACLKPTWPVGDHVLTITKFPSWWRQTIR
jgi:hypothetical protein